MTAVLEPGDVLFNPPVSTDRGAGGVFWCIVALIVCCAVAMAYDRQPRRCLYGRGLAVVLGSRTAVPELCSLYLAVLELVYLVSDSYRNNSVTLLPMDI